MQLKCIREFGNFNVGDTIDVPDGAMFDSVFFVKVDTPVVPPAVVSEGGK